MPRHDVDPLVTGILAGDRRHIARAITLVESSRSDHRELAHQLLAAIRPHTGNSYRVGISGVPGAGKSTFIDAMGSRLVGRGLHVGVLAVDPSSVRTGGSILGDRTRMANLATSDNAFVRPSPSSGHLGGVARATRESLLILEAAGYEVIIVETVGVGQSEVAVADMVDTFLLLHAARTGDQLQGIKRGILELAHVIAVTKADGDNEMAARSSARELAGAMRLITPDGERRPPVLACSAATGIGLDDVWQAVEEHRAYLVEHDLLEKNRADQHLSWLWALVDSELTHRVRHSPSVEGVRAQVEDAVNQGSLTAVDGAERLLAAFAHDLTSAQR